MIEAYRIGVSMFLETNIGTTLPRVTEMFEALNKIVKEAQANTVSLGAALRGIARAESGIRTLAASMERLHAAQARAAGSARNLDSVMNGMPTEAAAAAAAGAQGAGAGRNPRSRAPGPYSPAAPLYPGTALVPYAGGLPAVQGRSRYSAPAGGGAVVPKGWTFSGGGFMPDGPAGQLGGSAGGPMLLGYSPASGSRGNYPFSPGSSGYYSAGANGNLPATSAGMSGQSQIPLNLRPTPPRPTNQEFAQAGVGFGMLGAAVIDGVRHVMTPAIDVDRTLDVIGADTRLSPADLQGALRTARDNTRAAPGSTVGENLSSILDLKNVFGSLEEAQRLSPEFARMTTLLQTLDRKGGGGGEQSFAAAKAMEIMGAMTSERMENGQTIREMDPDKGMAYLRRMERVAVATNTRVQPSDYLGLARQARVAGMTLSDEFKFEKLPALLQVIGGSRTGTALMSMAQVFDGGKLTAKSMKAMQNIGLAGLDGIEHVGGHRNKRGQMIGGKDVVHPEAIYDLDTMRHDPLAYVEAASKRMDANGIHGSEAQIRALMNAAQRSTIAGILADLLKDQPAILKEQMNIRNTRPDQAQVMAATDPAAKVQQFEAALTNMATAIGQAGMKDAMAVLATVTANLSGLGKWAEAHPTLARVLFDVTAGLGGLAVAIGTASLSLFFAGPMIKTMRWFASADAVAAAANVAAFGSSMSGAAAAAKLGIAGLLAYGIGTGLRSGLDTVSGRAGDAVRSALGETGDQQSARHDYMQRYQRNQDSFSIFDRSTWNDPKSSFFNAVPRYTPMPSQANQTVNLRGNVTMDGKAVGNIVASGSTGPSSGTTGYDIRTGLMGAMPAD